MEIATDARGFVFRIVDALVSAGWRVSAAPKSGSLQRNKQILVLTSKSGSSAYRLLVYKVTGSGRSRPSERRIEITSTYAAASLQPMPGIQDAVLGYDPDADVFVGFDPRRLHHGGPTENASSFFDLDSVRIASADSIHVIPRRSPLFGIEFHAFLRPPRTAEYLANITAIHDGVYAGGGRFSRIGTKAGTSPLAGPAGDSDAVVLGEPEFAYKTPTPLPIPPSLRRDIERLEASGQDALSRRNLSPHQLATILRACDVNGRLGEEFVLDLERRQLRKAGRDDLAERVAWTSQVSVGAGYDISSFGADGSQRFVEVKSTIGSTRTFPISLNEWRVAEAKRDSYHIARVTSVRRSPDVLWLTDPSRLLLDGSISRREGGWLLSY